MFYLSRGNFAQKGSEKREVSSEQLMSALDRVVEAPWTARLKAAAQDYQVLRTEDGVGFQPTFAALSRGLNPGGERCDSMPHARAVETAAAQDNQVLRTEDGVGF
jgi:hypothetical protein